MKFLVFSIFAAAFVFAFASFDEDQKTNEPATQGRIVVSFSKLLDGRGATILRDTQTNTEYLCYDGGITKLEKP